MEPSELFTLVFAILLILIAIAIWIALRRRRSAILRDRFGDEYDRTLAATKGRGEAEANLDERARRVAKLDIRPLTPEERRTFTSEWNEVKAVFVDNPAEAVLHADRMLAEMIHTRGYPMADFDRRFEDLSVDHGEEARHYRTAHEVAERLGWGQTTTEELRQAMKHYEALFDHLVSDVSDTLKHRPITRPAQS